MTITRKVYFDWTKMDTWVDMSDHVVSVMGTIGRTDWQSRVADVGICIIELKNDLRYFSPPNAASPYFGQMVPNIPVRVDITDVTGTNTVLTVWTTDFVPTPDQYGKLRCSVICQDRMGQLQDADISLPIQIGQSPGDILKKITSTVYESGQAIGTVYMRKVAHTDRLSIGDNHYIFEDVLTPLANEVALESRPYYFGVPPAGGITDSAVNAAAAINRDERSGTDYAATTERNRDVTAIGTMGIGLDESNYDSDYDLQRAGAPLDGIAVSFSWAFQAAGVDIEEPVTLPMRRVYLYLKKVGAPTGTLTLQHEIPTGAGGSPSGTLYNASGIVTMDEADLDVAFKWVAFDFPAEYDMGNYSIPGVSNLHWLTLSTDRAAHAANYVVWGGWSGPTPIRFSDDTSAAAAWAGRTLGQAPLMFIPGILDLVASAHGAWGNGIALAGETTEYHLIANPTINAGAITSGSYTDTIEQDGVSLVMAEVPGAPGFDYEWTFPVNGTGLTVGCYVHYNGGSGHIVNFQAWNGAGWDTLATITDSAVFEFVSLELEAAHTIGGDVLIRTYHPHNGNPGHTLSIDHFYCISDEPAADGTMDLPTETLEGGEDGPVGAIDAEDGELFLAYAGDTWIEGEVNALTAGSDIAFSEFGLLWASRAGVITFKSQFYEFEQRNSTAEMACDDAHTGQTSGLHKADIINRVTLSYEPRAVLASAVIAKSNAPIWLSAVTDIGTARWNAYGSTSDTAKTTKTPGEKTVILPYGVDETSSLVGALSLEQPLISGTDYELWGTKDKTGPEVTKWELVKFALALVGSGVQVQMRNTVGRSGWVHDLQVRGLGLYRQDITHTTIEDNDSLVAYGLRPYQYSFTFPSTTVAEFADTLGWYFINRFKDPFFNIPSITFRGEETIGGVSVFALDIGDVITLTETQTAISGVNLMILGIDLALPENDVHAITFFVMRLNDTTYWELGTAGKSELGTTTVLAI